MLPVIGIVRVNFEAYLEEVLEEFTTTYEVEQHGNTLRGVVDVVELENTRMRRHCLGAWERQGGGGVGKRGEPI